MNGLPICHLNILAGPTGVGKTALAIKLAREWNMEIISADSMQVYRQLSIGTAKPTQEECGGIPYRLINCADIDEHYDLARFIREADECIARVVREGKRPLVVGGTGLYIKGLLEGIFEADSRSDEVREELRRRMKKEGLAPLYEELQRIDSEAAARIKPRDHQRILRALEVFLTTGIPISQLQKKSRNSRPRYPHTLLVLTRNREELYDRIEARVDEMFSVGLMEEVKGILDAGYSPDLHPLKALGYREMIRALREEWTQERAREEMKKVTRRYAKRQLTWFRGMTQAHWLNITGLSEEETMQKIRHTFSMI